MEKPVKRPVGRILGMAVLAVLVALVAAVSAFAVGGSTTTADNPATSPGQFQPVQSDATPTPERGERPGPGGREDCPEKDGAGQGGSQQEDQSTTPGTSSESSEL